MTLIRKNSQIFQIDPSTQTYSWWLNCFSKWEPMTFLIFDLFLNKSKNLIDIGSWIGTTVLYAAKISKNVYAIEPDPHSVIDLKKNIEINHLTNIYLCSRPIYNQITEIYFGPYADTWNSSSSQIKSKQIRNIDQLMRTITLKNLIDEYQIVDVGLIKVDIEGGEENIIIDLFNEAAKMNPKPPIYLSFHLSWWNNTDLSRFDQCWTQYLYIYHAGGQNPPMGSLCMDPKGEEIPKLDEKNLIQNQHISEFVQKFPFASLLFTDQLIK